jgi:hypothetical protein
MAWDNPEWRAEGITPEKLNARIRDNMTTLHAPPTDYYAYTYAASTYETTTSTSFAAIDANLLLSLTTTGGDVWLEFVASASNCYLDFVVNGSRVGGNDGLHAVPTLAAFGNPIRMLWLAQDLAAGTHTFDVYWKVASGTGSLFQYVPPYFMAREMS